ncbi:hypothetical protein [Tardisphaera saccharovorans]
MIPSDFAPGIVIKGPRWPEPVEIKRVETEDNYVHIIGATTTSRQYIDQLIPLSDLQEVSISELKNGLLSRAVEDLPSR